MQHASSRRCAQTTRSRPRIAAYRKDQPNITDLDVALEVASDMFHGETPLARRSGSGASESTGYMYYFTWKSPVQEGKLKAFHTLEIPFVFDNVDVASR